MKPDESFPYVAAWILRQGWIEIGSNELDNSMARALDDGGTVFVGGGPRTIRSLEDALKALEKGIKEWCEENGVDLMGEA